LEQSYGHALRSNWKSQKKVHRAFSEYRAALNRELEREALTPEERFRILEMIREAVDTESEKDSEHKAFVMKALGIVATAAVVVVGAGIAFVGGKVGIGRDGGA